MRNFLSDIPQISSLIGFSFWQLCLYAVAGRAPRVYPWVNEPGGGMMDQVEIVKTFHSVYRLQYHVVWVCKYRRRILNPGVRSYLRKLFPQLLRSMPEVKMEAIGFDQDRLHMVIVNPHKYSIASVMGQLKNQSASELRGAFAWLKKVYWKENLVWSPGYFVSSVGVDEETMKRYVPACAAASRSMATTTPRSGGQAA